MQRKHSIYRKEDIPSIAKKIFCLSRWIIPLFTTPVSYIRLSEVPGYPKRLYRYLQFHASPSFFTGNTCHLQHLFHPSSRPVLPVTALFYYDKAFPLSPSQPFQSQFDNFFYRSIRFFFQNSQNNFLRRRRSKPQHR